MIHKEGYGIVAASFFILAFVNFLIWEFLPMLFPFLALVSLVFFGLIVQFFRNPTRTIPKADDNLIYAPADGKVVVIEEAVEDEYFKEKRLQISIFMSPLNVHVNRNPFSGLVKYYRYHKGKYLVAWHPKSSTENERTTVVLDNGKTEILLRQIAGAVARRIRNYLSEGQQVQQGSEMGFIKFGSRVDLFLPLDAKVNVKIDDVVKGNKTVIAEV